MKLLVLLCGEDDDNLQIAAAGALAMLTAVQKKLCTKLTKVVCRTVFDSVFTVEYDLSCHIRICFESTCASLCPETPWLAFPKELITYII